MRRLRGGTFWGLVAGLIWLLLLGFDDRGKVRLAMKMVDQETGEELAPEKKTEDAE